LFIPFFARFVRQNDELGGKEMNGQK